MVLDDMSTEKEWDEMGSREAEGTAAWEIIILFLFFCHSGQWRQGG
jgi:hypothetical protein